MHGSRELHVFFFFLPKKDIHVSREEKRKVITILVDFYFICIKYI